MEFKARIFDLKQVSEPFFINRSVLEALLKCTFKDFSLSDPFFNQIEKFFVEDKLMRLDVSNQNLQQAFNLVVRQCDSNLREQLSESVCRQTQVLIIQ